MVKVRAMGYIIFHVSLLIHPLLIGVGLQCNHPHCCLHLLWYLEHGRGAHGNASILYIGDELIYVG